MSHYEIIPAVTKSVACDGGGGPLGHPLVYLNMGDKDEVCCPYCSRLFVLEPDKHPPAPVGGAH